MSSKRQRLSFSEKPFAAMYNIIITMNYICYCSEVLGIYL